MIYTQQTFQGHQVLVADPPVVPPGAPVVFLLHGLGTNGEDLAPLAGKLNLPHCRFVLPDAPLRLPGYPEGAYAWYNFESHDPKGFQASREYLLKLMDRFAQDPNLRPAAGADKKPSPVVMAGFSQGGVMALETGLLWKGGVQAICALSAYLPNDWEILQKAEAPFETPILLAHGKYDAVVPPEGSLKAAEALKNAGYKPERLLFEMDHAIIEEELEAVRDFLKKHI